MKTRKDQIDEMTKLIQAEYEQWLDTTGVIPKATTYYAECLGCAIDSAETLYNAGYGKVDEYKAEIERLKNEDKAQFDENEKLEAQVDGLNNLLFEANKEIERLKAENDRILTKLADVCMCIKNTHDIDINKLVKQAKIDVLNELKERAWQGYGVGMYIVNTQQIDELIKEIENESL